MSRTARLGPAVRAIRIAIPGAARRPVRTIKPETGRRLLAYLASKTNALTSAVYTGSTPLRKDPARGFGHLPPSARVDLIGRV